MQVSKTDVARRQLLAAIHLHWYLREPVAVYSLASNAAEICDTLLKRMDRLRLRREMADVHGCTEKEIAALINLPRNFLKHADRDADELAPEIEPDDCDAIVQTACIDYMMVAGRSPAIVGLFVVWYSAVYPEKTGTFFRREADNIFPALSQKSRSEQILAARATTSEALPSSVLHHYSNELSDNWRWAELRTKGGSFSALPATRFVQNKPN